MDGARPIDDTGPQSGKSNIWIAAGSTTGSARLKESMKIGIHAYGEDALTADGVDRARAMGAEGVCLGIMGIDGFAEDGVVRGDAMSDAVARYHDAGIEVPAGHVGSVPNEMMVGEPGFEEDYRKLVANIERMAAVGIQSLILYVTPERPSDPGDEARAMEAFVAFARRLGADAESFGVGIACHPWLSRPGLLHGFRRLKEVCDQVPNRVFGITFCPGGALAGDDMADVMVNFKDRIHFAHLRDQIGLWDDFEEVFPGTGEVGVADLVRGLRDSGYDGLICPEHLGPPKPGRDLEADALQFMKDVRDN
jgi:sugar phosphate isomerase/epimerase